MKPPKSRKADLGSNATGGEKPHAETAESAEFKMTELGPIPVDWEVAEISDLYEVRSSKRVFQSQWRSSGIPFYRARDIVGFRHGEQAIGGLFIDKALYEKYKRDYGVPSIDDLLVTAVGTLGSVFRVSNESPFYFKDGNIIWFKSKGKYDSRLLEVLFESGFLDSQIYDTAGGSTVGTYTISNAKKTLVPLPPLVEQRRIAGALSDVDELISALGKLIEKKRNIKTGAMQQLLTGKTRLPGFGVKSPRSLRPLRDEDSPAENAEVAEFKMTELGLIPKDWEVKRIDQCGDVVTGSTPPRGISELWGVDFNWISAKDFKGKYIVSSEERVTEAGKRYCRVLPANSVLVTCIASIGLNAIAKQPCATNQQINAVVCRECDYEYFYYQCCFNESRLRQMAGQTAVPIIGKSQFEEFSIVLPREIE